MIINLDQTPNTFEICSWLEKNIAKKGCKSVPIPGSAAFSITLTGKFSPIQLIYDGNTKKSIPAASFSSEYVVRANEKHYSNNKEA